MNNGKERILIFYFTTFFLKVRENINSRLNEKKCYMPFIKDIFNYLFSKLEDSIAHCHLDFTLLTDCVSLGTHIVTSSFKPASLNPKTASCSQF